MFKFLRRVFIILILLIIVFFVFRLVKPEATSRFVDKVKSIPTTISGRFHREKKSEIVINGNTTSTNSNFEINNNDENNEYYEVDYTQTNIDEDIYENNYETIENNGEVEDLSRLDELNRELDKIMTSGDNQNEGEYSNSDNTGNLGEIISGLVENNIQTNEISGNNQNTGFVVIDVEQPYEPEKQNSTNSQNKNTINNSTNNTTNNTNATNNTNSTNSNTTNNNSQTTSNNQNNNQNNTTPKKTNNTTTPQRGDCGSGLTVQDCEELYNVFGNLNIN